MCTQAILRVVAPPNCWAGQTIHVRSDDGHHLPNMAMPACVCIIFLIWQVRSDDGQMLPMTLPPGVHAGQARAAPRQPSTTVAALRRPAPRGTSPTCTLGPPCQPGSPFLVWAGAAR